MRKDKGRSPAAGPIKQKEAFAMRETGRDRDYASLPPEELERRLREAFFYPDQIDETVFRELEGLREALEEKRPPEPGYTAEESWERFLEDRAEELEELWGPEEESAPEPARRTAERRKPRRFSALLRVGLASAALLFLLAGAALAADSLGLVAWIPRWNGTQYAPVPAETAGTLSALLAELEITEPVYPARLPKGFILTESRYSTDPLVLAEQYARGNDRLSILITPIMGFETAVYQKGGETAQEYRIGKAVHYVFEAENTVTAIWYTQHYATSISGNITREEIKGILDSMDERASG